MDTIDGGDQIRVSVDKDGNSVVWMLAHLITAEGAALLSEALAANRVYYRRLDVVPRHLATRGATSYP